MKVEAFAPAKINLTLHVTGLRADGYHLLDSLVVFADIGDTVFAQRAQAYALSVDGPYGAGIPTDDGNLAMAAARLFGPDCASELHLIKNLPAASGIGGGSSDAAATLRALSRLCGRPLPNGREVLGLGADVPVCLTARSVRMGGVGEKLSPVATPQLHMVLANPGVSMPTPKVFAALPRKDNAAMPDDLPNWKDATAFCHWLAGQRNDLQAAAISLSPEIDSVIAALNDTRGRLLARMSGSGATCFGLYADAADALSAQDALRSKHPDWWVQAGRTISGLN